jgi:hypothetical protein
MAADIARKHDPQLADLYRRLMVERGRHHNQALCAVATHLMNRIYAVIRENRAYEPRDLHGNRVAIAVARQIAQSLAIPTDVRKRLRAIKKREEGPREPNSRQPESSSRRDMTPQPQTTSSHNPGTETG